MRVFSASDTVMAVLAKPKYHICLSKLLRTEEIGFISYQTTLINLCICQMECKSCAAAISDFSAMSNLGTWKMEKAMTLISSVSSFV